MTTTIPTRSTSNNNSNKERGKAYRLMLEDVYLGYIVLSNRLDKELLESIDPEILKQILLDVSIEEFEDTSNNTKSILSKYLKK